jgi:cell division septation protein DedD
MARNVQLKSNINQAARQYSGQVAPRESTYGGTNSLRGAMKLTFKQILLFWSVTLVMMLVVFVSGYKAGKVEGAREVLDQVDQQMVRLPIIRPSSIYAETNEGAELPLSDDSVYQPEGMVDTRKIDFTKEAELPLSEKPDLNLSPPSPQLPSVIPQKKPEDLYEEIYPGKKLFPPPSSKNDVEEIEELSLIQPLPPKEVKPLKPKEVPLSNFAPVPGWYVQVAAAPSKADAMNLHGKITGEDLSVSIEEASIRDKTYFRILVGPYEDRKTALSNRGKIKSASGISGEPFIRQVK